MKNINRYVSMDKLQRMHHSDKDKMTAYSNTIDLLRSGLVHVLDMGMPNSCVRLKSAHVQWWRDRAWQETSRDEKIV